MWIDYANLYLWNMKNKTAKITKKKSVSRTKKQAKIKEFVSGFYEKHGKVMSKLANE